MSSNGEIRNGPVTLLKAADWDVQELEDVTGDVEHPIVDGPFGSQMKVKDFSDEGYVPILEMEHLQKPEFEFSDLDRFISQEKYEEVKRSRVRSEDVVLSKTGTIGAVGVVGEDITNAIITSRLAKITPDKQNLSPYFLEYFIDFLRRKGYWESVATGTTMLVLNLGQIRGTKISLPPLEEQRKIATVLYTIDQAIQKTDEIIEKTQRVKKGLMQDLFSKGYYDHELKKGNHRWAHIPKSWELTPLNSVVKTNPRYDKPDREIAYIEMDAVNEAAAQPNYIGLRNPQNNSGRRFKEKDTLFARITPCTENGKICFVDSINTNLGIASTELAVLSPNQERIQPKFLYHYSRTQKVRNYAISRMRGSTGRQRVPFSVFKKELHIPLPDKKEQKEIAGVLDKLDAKKTKLNKNKKRLQRLKKGVMQDLLTGKIRTDDKDIEISDTVLPDEDSEDKN